MCHCKHALNFKTSFQTDIGQTGDRTRSKSFDVLSSGAFNSDNKGLIRQHTNATYRFISREVYKLSEVIWLNRSKILRARRELTEKRVGYFGLTGAKYKDGILLYNQFILLKDFDEKIRNGRTTLEQNLHPWPTSAYSVTVKYFFSSNGLSDAHKRWFSQAAQDITQQTCVTMEKAPLSDTSTCDSAVMGSQNSLCIMLGERCYSRMGAVGNPSRLVANETCLTPIMALRLVATAVGLGYQQWHTNYMQADENMRAAHSFCFSQRQNLGITFDPHSAAAVGFTIDTGSSEYAPVHVTPRAEDQVILQTRGRRYQALRNVDIGQINTFNQCEMDAYSEKCGEQKVKYCHDRRLSAKTPNIVGVSKKCQCLCRDGWRGKRCDEPDEQPPDRTIYGCHKHIMLYEEDVGGTAGIFRLRDIGLDTGGASPLLCTVSVRTMYGSLGYYCPGYSPIISVDATHLYRALVGFQPFGMHEACASFRVYYQSGVDAYQRRLLCLDSVLENSGRLELRPAGPNTTLFFVMTPQNGSISSALEKIQVSIHNRLNVICDSIVYYRNPLSFNVHRSEFVLHTKYLVQFLIGAVVFLIVSYIVYDYWNTRRRLQAQQWRREARHAGGDRTSQTFAQLYYEKLSGAKSVRMVQAESSSSSSSSNICYP